MARRVWQLKALPCFEALPFKGRVWEGMGFRTDRVWFDITLADRKPIPTPALPLKGRGKSPGWKEDSSPPRPLVDLGRGVKAIQRCRSEEHTSELQSLMRNSY